LTAKVLLKKAKEVIKKNKIFRTASEQIAKDLESDYPFSGFGWFDLFQKIVGVEDRDKNPRRNKEAILGSGQKVCEEHQRISI